MEGDNRDIITAPQAARNTRRCRRAVVPISAAASSMPLLAAPYSSEAEQDLAVDLDYVPSLGPLREFLCVLGPVVLVLAAYAATGRWHGGSWLAKLAGVVTAASCVSLVRTAWMEKEYKARERAHAALGDSDSRFRPIVTAADATSMAARAAGAGAAAAHGSPLVVHVKVKVGDVAALRDSNGSSVSQAGFAGGTDPVSAMLSDGGSGHDGNTAPAAPAAAADPVFAVHCYHGFGANLGSYKRVQDELAAALRGVVTAHDMPGFGLTQRPSDMSSYFLTFNGRLGRLVMDYELQQLGLLGGGAAADGRGAASAGGGRAVAAAAAAAAAEPQPTPSGDGMQSTFVPPVSAGGGDGGSGSGTVVVTVGGPVREGADGAAEAQPRRKTAGSRRGVAPEVKRILIGHSLGGACAALEAVSDPEGLAGLVLVAPAIVALPGPEYSQVTLSPDRPDGAATGTAAAGASTSAATAAAAARAAVYLGSEPPGSHVTDPPEVRRLYPVGAMPTHGGGAAGSGGGNGRNGGAARRLLRAGGTLLGAVASLMLLVLLKLLTPIITLLLRSLVRRRTFWIKGLQQAYYNPAALTPDLVDAYRMPQLVRGWEAGMVNFLLARLAGPRAGLGALFRDAILGGTTAAAAAATRGGAAAAAATATAASAAAADAEASVLSAGDGSTQDASPASPPTSATTYGNDDADLASRLSALVSERRLPVLLVHGLYDRLVPASNSQRLARMLPGCELVLLDRCGHMPQEEMPGLFVDLVTEFAARIEPYGLSSSAAVTATPSPEPAAAPADSAGSAATSA